MLQAIRSWLRSLELITRSVDCEIDSRSLTPQLGWFGALFTRFHT